MIQKALLLTLLLAGSSFAWEDNTTTGFAGAFDQTVSINSQIMLDHNQTGLVSYWDFEEGSGNISYDYTKANNGTMYNGVARTAAGKYSSAIQLDGVNDYIDAGNAASLNIANSITLEAWIKFSSPAGRIIAKETDNFDTPYLIYALGAGQLAFFTSNTGPSTYAQATAPLTYNDNAWHHVVGTYDGSTVNLYVDGAQKGSASWTRGLKPSSEKTFIGASRFHGTPTMFFNGTIDEVRIYNRTLSNAEINASMNGQVRYTSGNYTSLSIDAGAANEWKNISAVFIDGGANTSTDLYAAVNNDNLSWAFALVQANAANNTAYSLPTKGRYMKIRTNEKTNDGAYTDRLQKIAALYDIAILPVVSVFNSTTTDPAGIGNVSLSGIPLTASNISYSVGSRSFSRSFSFSSDVSAVRISARVTLQGTPASGKTLGFEVS